MGEDATRSGGKVMTKENPVNLNRTSAALLRPRTKFSTETFRDC